MPIPFTCPHCGKFSEVDEKYAGQSGPCQSCGETIAVPAAGGATAATAATYNGAGPGSRKRTALIVILVVVIVAVVAGAIFLLVLPGVRAIGDGPRKVHCKNNLREIAMALQNYEARYKCFPPAYIADENGKPMHSWRVLILSCMEQQGLYERYDFSKPWDSPENTAVAMQMPDVFRCPAAKDTAPNATSYMLITGPDSLFEGDRAPRAAQVYDGMSRTLLVVETKGSTVTWTEPVDLDFEKMSFQVGGGPGEIGSDHVGNAAVVVFGDGHTVVLPKEIDPETLRAICTPRGDETLVEPCW